MKKIALVLMLGFTVAVPAAAQDSAFSRMEIVTTLQRPPAFRGMLPSAHIKNIQTLDGGWGVAYTNDSIFHTSDGGATWNAVNLQLGLHESITTIVFADRLSGFAILSNSVGKLFLLRTDDGGNSWERRDVDLADARESGADLTSGELEARDARLELSFRITTSSNFLGSIKYVSRDDGLTWQFVEKRVELRTSDDVDEKRSGSWVLRTEGTCVGFKTGCVQETKIISGDMDITPQRIVELSRIEKEKAAVEATPLFAVPPGGSTRISLNRGFDKCTAAPASQMQTWWDNSYFHDANIYMSGRNRGCAQPQLTATWVDQVSSMGWGLIPTVVGYQSPCTTSTTTAKLSYDVAVAEQQGRGEADIAISDALALGFGVGTILYYDMEVYTETVSTPGCRLASTAFMKGWTERLREQGYKSGAYGNPRNIMEDWVPFPPASKMDAIWIARWDNNPNVWSIGLFPSFPTNEWNNHQRIKQWQAPHNETWGGVTFNIDGNIADGPVAGLAIPKNRTADFDGDRKSDISVFRPDTGVWYIQKSNGSGYIINAFGISTDIPTPGDYDGDGKTDQAVFRPSDATWHMLTKAGFYTARAFGSAGDIPAAADFNGDGKTDLAVFRPSSGVWYIANSDSLGTYTIVQFGLTGDLPVTGDYDGDGKADIAVWRPSSGTWYVSRSSDSGFTAVAFGISTDRPAEGDFDGDGKTDFAVLRNGTWYLLQTTSGFSQFNFGITGDLPVTGDFDGDGKDDAAVFRPSTGVWYLLQSQNGVYAQQFGISGDKPIPNAYLPQM